MITKSFETASGRKVEVTGELVILTNTVKYKIDVVVEGFGSQGGIVSRGKFTYNGAEYEGRVGKLPLTKEQMKMMDQLCGELMAARDNHPLMEDKKHYGTYEEVEIIHPWMKNTY